MSAILDMPLRDVLRAAAGYVFVGVVLWLPVIWALVSAKP